MGAAALVFPLPFSDLLPGALIVWQSKRSRELYESTLQAALGSVTRSTRQVPSSAEIKLETGFANKRLRWRRGTASAANLHMMRWAQAASRSKYVVSYVYSASMNTDATRRAFTEYAETRVNHGGVCDAAKALQRGRRAGCC